MSGNQPGAREQALRKQREDDDSIPDFLDRTKGLSNEQIAALSARARKNAGRVRKHAAPMMRPRESNLTEADKVAIRELKKLGADRVSVVRKHGAKLKHEEKTAMVKKTKKATKAKAAPAAKKAKVAPVEGVRAGSKLEIIVGLLKRPDGCTTKDVLSATGWPTVSMPQMAKSAGLTLKKEKVDGVNRYRAA